MSVAQAFDSIVMAQAKAHTYTLITKTLVAFWRKRKHAASQKSTQVTITSQGLPKSTTTPILGNSTFKKRIEDCNVYIIAVSEANRDSLLREFIGNSQWGGAVDGIIEELNIAQASGFTYEVSHVTNYYNHNNKYTGLIKIRREVHS